MSDGVFYVKTESGEFVPAVREGMEESPLRDPEDVVSYLGEKYPDMVDEDNERLIVVVVNTRRRPLGAFVHTVGTLDASLVCPRSLFRVLLRDFPKGHSFLVAHNHPSGDPVPSPEDIALTRRLIKAGDLLNYPLIDHLVVSYGGYTSLRASTTCW